VASPTILISAGEASGDLHGSLVARALRARWPDATLYGLGGPRMAAEGVELLADMADLAVMGFVEVIGRLPYFVRLLGRMEREIGRRATDLVLPIDYPGFNLRLARKASAAGVPVLYYIAPQVWAWHRSRARALARHADRLAVILPFEESFFAQAGTRVCFVGHPLLDQPGLAPGPPEGEENRLFREARPPVVALLPGSRTQEVKRHLELFQDAAAILQARDPELQPVIAAASNLPRTLFRAARFPLAADAPDLLARARGALVKSGTGTLEAALRGTPMAIAYRAHPLSYELARRLVGVEHIGLVNLIAGKRAFPELVQGDATPRALADALAPYLADGPVRRQALAELSRVRERLQAPPDGYGSVAERVSGLAAELLDAR
jgi:lipid-A-disaccharide synthase